MKQKCFSWLSTMPILAMMLAGCAEREQISLEDTSAGEEVVQNSEQTVSIVENPNEKENVQEQA